MRIYGYARVSTDGQPHCDLFGTLLLSLPIATAAAYAL
jgi:hypothetical protein